MTKLIFPWWDNKVDLKLNLVCFLCLANYDRLQGSDATFSTQHILHMTPRGVIWYWYSVTV